MESNKDDMRINKSQNSQTDKTIRTNARNRNITDQEVEKVLKEAKMELQKKSGPLDQEKTNDNIPQNTNSKEQQISNKQSISNQKSTDQKSVNLDNKEIQMKKESIKTENKKEIQNETRNSKETTNDKILIEKSLEPVSEKTESVRSRIAGSIFEGIWTGFKIIILLFIVTIVAGYLNSKDLLIRGENGSRQALSDMEVSSSVYANKSNEDKRVKKWLASVKREKISLKTDDESILIARKIVIDEESDRWVVILHGYNGSMQDVYDIAMHYAKEGYNILTPDLRASGESEGKFLGMGWNDRLDLINWIDVILKENPSAKVVVHGIDVGADAALMMTGEPLKNSIKAVVAEGAYPRAWDVVKKEYKARHPKLPAFPFLNMANPVMKVIAGYDLKEANAIKQVKNAEVPILLIQGEKDTYVTEDMAQKINQAIASTHELYQISSGTHGDCRYAEPENYYNKTFQFVNSYVK